VKIEKVGCVGGTIGWMERYNAGFCVDAYYRVEVHNVSLSNVEIIQPKLVCSRKYRRVPLARVHMRVSS
jgi:hypothetical protein